jgi:very-short-patch-repair endonuclease
VIDPTPRRTTLRWTVAAVAYAAAYAASKFGLTGLTEGLWLDLAGALQRHQLQQAINEAERQRLEGRQEQARRHPTKRGTKALRTLAPPTHTRRDLEARFTTFLNDRRFPMPQTNVLIEGVEVDAAWPDKRLIVELDSWEYHKTRQEFERDRRRDRQLAAKGWTVLRIRCATWTSPAPSRPSSQRSSRRYGR